MRIIWVGDTPTVSSGFGVCTREVCTALHIAGHEVHVLGMSYYGDAHDYPFTIWPCHQPLDHGRDGFGVTRLPALVKRLSPDLIVLLNDPWNIPAYFEHLDLLKLDTLPPTVGWLAVDSRNQRVSDLSRLDHVVVWTDFARDEFRSQGYDRDISIVPLGVDTTLFTPKRRSESRARIGLPDAMLDRFIVGVVGRNQPRKRLDLTLQYFADWVKRYDRDAFMFMHVAPTGDLGCDLRSLISYYGLAGRVGLSEPHVGIGADKAELPYLYSAFDVYFTTTQGEGWGLPALESMACGTPVIAPDWSALGSWAKGVARLVPCTSHALTAPLNDHPYTIGGIMDRDMAVEALETEYQEWQHDREQRTKGFSADPLSDRQRRISAGLSLAQSLTWRESARKFRELLESRYWHFDHAADVEVETCL